MISLHRYGQPCQQIDQQISARTQAVSPTLGRRSNRVTTEAAS
jgi:hypothetical protein